MVQSTSEIDDFYVQIRRHMIQSGEWDRYIVSLTKLRPFLHSPNFRILRLLSCKLSEHGWVDETCRRVQGTPPFSLEHVIVSSLMREIHRTRTVNGYAVLPGRFG